MGSCAECSGVVCPLAVSGEEAATEARHGCTGLGRGRGGDVACAGVVVWRGGRRGIEYVYQVQAQRWAGRGHRAGGARRGGFGQQRMRVCTDPVVRESELGRVEGGRGIYCEQMGIRGRQQLEGRGETMGDPQA